MRAGDAVENCFDVAAKVCTDGDDGHFASALFIGSVCLEELWTEAACSAGSSASTKSTLFCSTIMEEVAVQWP
jgi:hypothetical protein